MSSTIVTNILRAAAGAAGGTLRNFGDDFAKFAGAYGDDFSIALTSPKNVKAFLEQGDEAFRAAGYSDDFLKALASSADNLSKATNRINSIVSGYKSSGNTNFDDYLAKHIETLRGEGVYLSRALTHHLKSPAVQARILGTADDAARGATDDFARAGADDAGAGIRKPPPATTKAFTTVGELDRHLLKVARKLRVKNFKIMGRDTGLTRPFHRVKLEPSLTRSEMIADLGERAAGLGLDNARLAQAVNNAIDTANSGRWFVRKGTLYTVIGGGAAVAVDHTMITPLQNGAHTWGLPGGSDRNSLYDFVASPVQSAYNFVASPFQTDTDTPTAADTATPIIDPRTGFALPQGSGLSGIFDKAVNVVDTLGGDMINAAGAKMIVGGLFAILGITAAGLAPGWAGLALKATVLTTLFAAVNGSKIDAGISDTIGGAFKGLKDAIAPALQPGMPGT